MRLFVKNSCERVLKNGLRILVYPLKTIPKVSLQLWYAVGSKQEKEGQKGISQYHQQVGKPLQEFLQDLTLLGYARTQKTSRTSC